MHARAALAVAFAALVAVAPALASGVRAGTTTPSAVGSAQEAVAAAPKVVIVVGATSAASTLRTRADAIAAEALQWTPNVVKVYSPNATWAAVKAAAQDASIFVYMGHGNGWPSPYTSYLRTETMDGMGLNQSANAGDTNTKYYGEDYVDGSIRFAPNAIVLLNSLCYAPGAGEPGMAEPSVSTAKQRVDNYASGFIRAGARAVMADDYWGSVEDTIEAIFTTHQPILSVWRSLWANHGHEIPWQPTRNPAFQAIMDPETWTTGFKRSLVTDSDFQTDDVLAGAPAVPTASDPSTLTAPGAASVAVAGLAVYTDQALGTATGDALAAGTKVRVDDVAGAAAQVHTLNGSVSGWVSAGGLVPRDSVGPALWSSTGQTTISPNFDGHVDRLAMWHRLSESAAWTATVVDPDGDVVRSQAGTSDMPPPSWDGLVGGSAAPAGTYHWTLHAQDAWGNPALDASGDITVVEEPVPTTAVLAFKSLNGTYTKASVLGYRLTFASGVTGVTAGDFSRTGTATSCKINAPTGGGTTWYLTVSSCSSGTVLLTLKAGSVRDASLTAGPPVSAASPYLKIDRTHPSEAAPKAAIKTGVSLTGSALPVTVSWSATDSGSGVASYDVARSVDGGAFSVIASKVTSKSLVQTLSTSHTYRYEARARDKAGNVSLWVAGPTLRPTLVQQNSSTVAWTGAWTTVSDAAYWGGSARTASDAGAAATLTFTGRALSVVVTRDPAYGQVKVYLDGTYLTTVDTTAASHLDRAVAYSRGVTWGTHTLKLVVVGTPGRPQVVVDAFGVIR